jgi:hypothetical protein
MWYVKVIWRHDFADEPVMLYSEIGDDGYEARKVEVFRDGRATFAGDSGSTGSTRLAEAPFPALEEIAAQEEFVPEAIDADEFERIWSNAQNSARR